MPAAIMVVPESFVVVKEIVINKEKTDQHSKKELLISYCWNAIKNFPFKLICQLGHGYQAFYQILANAICFHSLYF